MTPNLENCNPWGRVLIQLTDYEVEQNNQKNSQQSYKPLIFRHFWYELYISLASNLSNAYYLKVLGIKPVGFPFVLQKSDLIQEL